MKKRMKMHVKEGVQYDSTGGGMVAVTLTLLVSRTQPVGNFLDSLREDGRIAVEYEEGEYSELSEADGTWFASKQLPNLQ